MNEHLLTQRWLRAETRARIAEERYTYLWRFTAFSNVFWLILYLTKG